MKLSFPSCSSPRPAPPPAAPAPAAPPPPPTRCVSPEVHADRRLTFRLRAPRASEVAVAGEWARPGAAANTPQKMTRDAEGVWSITVGPVEPNIYIYVFHVDGMVLTDPVNPLVKLRARTSASMVEVPGGMPWEFRDVPHGALETHTHASAGAARGPPARSWSTPRRATSRTRGAATRSSTSCTATTTWRWAGPWPGGRTSSSTTCRPRRRPSP